MTTKQQLGKEACLLILGNFGRLKTSSQARTAFDPSFIGLKETPTSLFSEGTPAFYQKMLGRQKRKQPLIPPFHIDPYLGNYVKTISIVPHKMFQLYLLSTL